ncbi:MAG: hypothetical protein QOE70_604 [Chthoniobacter sp.]|jgi:hypothetical protein|nr:hypothetical protein [Chthoniobacter sp.]
MLGVHPVFIPAPIRGSSNSALFFVQGAGQTSSRCGLKIVSQKLNFFDSARYRQPALIPMRITLLAVLLSTAFVYAASEFDWTRARELAARAQRGESLGEGDRQLLDEAARRRKAGERPAGEEPAPPARPIANLTPLTELKEPYYGHDGGLYGAGQNDPPPAQAALAARAIAQIRPLDAQGNPAPDGKIALLSLGMSNATQEFSVFVKKANADPRKAPQVVVVDGAQEGMDATAWVTADAKPWTVVEQQLTAAHVSTRQVQAVWIKQALKRPTRGFPGEADALRSRLRETVVIARQKYPNLRVAYLSSRIYAGYALSGLNPEPYAYESAFAVRGLIQEQMHDTPRLNADPAKGEIKAPVLLWGPYLWANGRTPRQGDGLTYAADEFAGDGIHPGNSAREKVARLLLDFFTTNPLAKPWFTAPH